jgi:hypothetical protein
MAGGTSQVSGNNPGLSACKAPCAGRLVTNSLLSGVRAWGCRPPCVDSLFCIAVVQPLYYGCRLPGTSHVFGGIAISGPSTACCASLHALECMPAIDACLQGNSALAHASDTGNVVWFWRAAVSRCAPQLPTSYLFLLPPPVCRFAGTQLNPTAHRFARLCLKDCYSVCVVTAT